jgi:hypothetical protein
VADLVRGLVQALAASSRRQSGQVSNLIDIFFRRGRRDPKLKAGIGADPRPQLWFCPSPGTPDWRALADPATFAMLAADCDALQLYQDQLLDLPMPAPGLPRTALPPQGWNTWRAFREWGILSMAAAHNLRVIVESPGLKEWSPDPTVYVDRILESARIARAIGGSIHDVAFDEPFTAGLHIRQPAWSASDVLVHVRAVRQQVQECEPSIEVGLIEAYPTLDVELLCSIVETFSPAFLHLDIDYRAARQRGSVTMLQADLARLADCCWKSKIPFGVIIWGYEEDTAETFMRSARTLLAVVQQAVIRGDLSWPDRLIVQSWSAAAVLGPRLIPPTLPPDGSASLWGLLRIVKRSL